MALNSNFFSGLPVELKAQIFALVHDTHDGDAAQDAPLLELREVARDWHPIAIKAYFDRCPQRAIVAINTETNTPQLKNDCRTLMPGSAELKDTALYLGNVSRLRLEPQILETEHFTLVVAKMCAIILKARKLAFLRVNVKNTASTSGALIRERLETALELKNKRDGSAVRLEFVGTARAQPELSRLAGWSRFSEAGRRREGRAERAAREWEEAYGKRP